METIIEQPLNATAIPIVKNRDVIARAQRVSHHRVRDQTQIDNPICALITSFPLALTRL